MRSIFKDLRVLALAAAAVAAIPAAHAQATRTWVSGVGDDVNPCSRTAPCKTWAGAISKTAAGGEINAIDPGPFGTLTITKAITIDGGGVYSGVLATGGIDAFNVNVPAGTVVIIRNVSINGAGSGQHGIDVFGSGEIHLENLAIQNFLGQGVNFVPSSGTGILNMNNVSIRNAAAGAVLVKPGASATASAVLNNVTMVGNARGVRAEDGASVVVRNSHASHNDANGFVGMAVAGRAVEMSIEGSVSSGNGAAGVYSGALTTVRLSNTTVTRNLDGLIATGGGLIISAGNNRLLGNIATNAMPSSVAGQQ